MTTKLQLISSDTNIWLDFEAVGHLELPFMLGITYLMSRIAITEELIEPGDIANRLYSYGLQAVELNAEEYDLVSRFRLQYPRLSKHDAASLAIAKTRSIPLITGDKPLRNAARQEGVPCIGTLWVLDRLFEKACISECLYKSILQAFLNHDVRRLPKQAIWERLMKF